MLLVEVLSYNRDLPLQVAQRALIDRARIQESDVLADQWLYIVFAAHNSKACPALVAQASSEIPERAADLQAALAHYSAALAPV